MTRTEELTAQVQEQTGARYTQELLAIKQRDVHVTAEAARTAAWLATLNRKERRRVRRTR